MRPFDLSIDDPNTPQTTTSKTPRDDRKDPSQEDIFARILGGARSDTDTPSRPGLALEAAFAALEPLAKITSTSYPTS